MSRRWLKKKTIVLQLATDPILNTEAFYVKCKYIYTYRHVDTLARLWHRRQLYF